MIKLPLFVIVSCLASQALAGSSASARGSSSAAAAAAAVAASSAAINASRSAVGAALSPAGCGSCHEEVFPIRDLETSGMFDSDPKAWDKTRSWSIGITRYEVYERSSGEVRRFYRFKQSHVPDRYFLPSKSAKNPHELLD